MSKGQRDRQQLRIIKSEKRRERREVREREEEDSSATHSLHTDSHTHSVTAYITLDDTHSPAC